MGDAERPPFKAERVCGGEEYEVRRGCKVKKEEIGRGEDS